MLSGLVVARGDFGVFTQLPLRKGGANKQYVYVFLQANQSELRKEGVTWPNDSYYKIVGLHFNSKWPCQGHHMPACLPGLLETQCYWTKAAAPQRHTQQLFSVATYHLMTLTEGKAAHELNTSSLRGNDSHRLQQLNVSNNIVSYHKERAVDVSEPDLFSHSILLLKATNIQVNKARRKHGNPHYQWQQ